MSRPAWSPAAFLNRVRMSNRARLFVVVEGISTDKWFYEELCLSSHFLKAAGYEIYSVDSISDDDRLNAGGGKSRVLELYRFASKRKSLTVSNKHQTNSIMFCVDADHDRIANSIIRSRHVTYTRLPDVEAHLIDCLDVVTFFRRSRSATIVEARGFEGQLGDWRETIANSWKGWFELCLTAHLCGIRNPALGTPPKLVKGALSECDADAITGLRSKIVDRVGEVEFDKQYARAVDRLSSVFGRNKGYILLKGKWLISHLRRKVNDFSTRNGLQSLGNDEAAWEAIKGAVSFSPQWTRYFVKRFEKLLSVS
jgi:hypothetical protein